METHEKEKLMRIYRNPERLWKIVRWSSMRAAHWSINPHMRKNRWKVAAAHRLRDFSHLVEQATIDLEATLGISAWDRDTFQNISLSRDLRYAPLFFRFCEKSRIK